MIALPRSRDDIPRVALGVIRIVNGASALVAPKGLMRRLGVDAEADRAAVYGLRMFGVRTVLIGFDLLSSDDDVRRRAVALAPVIHGSDTTCAAVAGVQGDLPKRAAALATLVSAFNLALAVLAWKDQRRVARSRRT